MSTGIFVWRDFWLRYWRFEGLVGVSFIFLFFLMTLVFAQKGLLKVVSFYYRYNLHRS